VLDAFEQTEHESRVLTFKAASDAVSSSGGGLGDTAKLQLYGLYKQGTVGPCRTSRPSMMDMVNRAKWDAWHSLGEMCKEEAQIHYVELVDKYMPRWYNFSDASPAEEGSSNANEGSKFGMGPVFSSLIHHDDNPDCLSQPLSGMHVLAQQGEAEALRAAAEAGTSIKDKDEEGRTPLHWAADMGHADAVQVLVAAGAPINEQDASGMTALHCAAVCEHKEICQTLLFAGADACITDEDGECAKDVMPEDWLAA